MKITEEAKKIIQKFLEENGSDTLVVTIGVSSCCGGKSIQLDLGNAKDMPRVIEVNGVLVAIGEADEAQLKDMTFSTQNGQLSLEEAGCGCGCGGEECHCQ